MNRIYAGDGQRGWRGVLVALVLVPATVGAAWAVLVAGTGSAPLPQPQPRLLTVLTRPLVAESGYRVPRLFTGQLEARRSTEVGFELDGVIAGVMVEEGDEVAAGALLATLDDARLQARRAELAAALGSANARLALARSTHRRIQGLVERKHASAQELDEAREGRRTLRAEVALAQARLDSVAVELAKTRLTAPFDAVVIRRPVDEGRVVSAGTPVLALQEAAAPEARVGVTRWMAATLVPGQRYALDVDGHALSATLRAVLPLQHGATRSVEAILQLDAQPLTLRSGELARLALSRAVAARGFWVPLDALGEGRRGTWSVYVARAADDGVHRIERRSVQVLHQQGDRVYVQGSLAPGEQLVDAGPHRVVPGQRVAVIDSGTRVAVLESRP